ncbi:hypothetical protein GQ457_03G021850 [Hibiscus cannabinus]
MIWNCQGATSSSFRDHFLHTISSARSSLVALLEMCFSQLQGGRVIRRLGFPFSFWIEAKVCYCSEHFFLLIVYATPNIMFIKHVCLQIASLNLGSDHPWLIGGDFNAILHTEDRYGCVQCWCSVSRGFTDFLFDEGLQEVEFKGLRFT